MEGSLRVGTLILFAVLLVVVLLPILALYDVVVNERTLSPLGLAGMSVTFRAVHTFYMIASHVVVVISVIGAVAVTPSLRDILTDHKNFLKAVVICLLPDLYILPFCWFLFAVPGYWDWYVEYLPSM